MPEGYNVIYMVELTKTFNVNVGDGDEDQTIYDLIKNIDFDLGKLFVLPEPFKGEQGKSIKILNSNDVISYKDKYNRMLMEKNKIELSRLKKKLKHSIIHSKWKIKDIYDEIIQIHRDGKIEFKLHIGGDGIEINDLILDFVLTEEDNNNGFKFGIICESNSEENVYDTVKEIDEEILFINDGHDKAAYLSDLMDFYGPGTYLFPTCRGIPINGIDEESMSVMRAISGIDPSVTNYDLEVIECMENTCEIPIQIYQGSKFTNRCKCKLFFCQEHILPEQHDCNLICAYEGCLIKKERDYCSKCAICGIRLCRKHFIEHSKIHTSFNVPSQPTGEYEIEDLDRTIKLMLILKNNCLYKKLETPENKLKMVELLEEIDYMFIQMTNYYELITKSKEYLEMMRIYSFELFYTKSNTRFLELV